MTPDKSLKKVFKETAKWLAYAEQEGQLSDDQNRLRAGLAKDGPLHTPARRHLDWLGHYYGHVAIDAFGKGDTAALAQSLRWAVAYRSLGFRFGAMDPPKGTDVVQLREFVTSLKAIGPAMLSAWDEAATNAGLLIAYAEAEQVRNAFPGSEREQGWGKGTHDAFVIALVAQAFDVPTTYTPENPLIPAYQDLLDHWRTPDQATFQQAMAPAIAFHLERSKGSTNKVEYEFNAPFDTVFPAELLIVQALRRRDGLPAFDAGHALVDAPWAALRDLPNAEPPPLLAETLARLQSDYPRFR